MMKEPEGSRAMAEVPYHYLPRCSRLFGMSLDEGANHLAKCWEHHLASRFRVHGIDVVHQPRLWGLTPDLKVGESTIVECAVLQIREDLRHCLNTTGGYVHGGSVEESGKKLHRVVSEKVENYGSQCERDGLAYVIALRNQSEEWHEAADVLYGDSSPFVTIDKSTGEVIKSGTRSLIVEKHGSTAPVFSDSSVSAVLEWQNRRAVLWVNPNATIPVDESEFPFALAVHAGDSYPNWMHVSVIEDGHSDDLALDWECAMHSQCQDPQRRCKLLKLPPRRAEVKKAYKEHARELRRPLVTSRSTESLASSSY